MKNKVLVIAVHPDDETLGAGGTLLKHKKNGDEIHWLICSTLDENHHYYQKREEEIQEVLDRYQFDSVHNLRLETTKIDQYTMSELVEKISTIFNKIEPNVVYLPFKSDAHSDHRKIFEASFACIKSFRSPFIKKVYMMETLSETEFSPSTKEDSFIPNVFVDISNEIEKKIEIIKIFESELFEHPFPRSEENIRALACFRGATAGCKAAESFMLLKEVK